jgi:hypothetical protein
MSLLTKVAHALQTVFTDQAEQAARDSGFCQRAAKLGGAVFTQAVVFGCLGKPWPTLNDFVQAAAAADADCLVSAKAFDQRFTPQAAECLRLVLAAAVRQVLAAETLPLPLLQRFTAVQIQDSTTIVLPACLEHLWQGCGGTANKNRAAVKFQVRLDLRSGQLTGPFPQAGRCPDSTSPLQDDDPPAGALRVADLGYWDLDVFGRLGRCGAFWLSRWKFGVALYEPQGQRLDLVAWLRQHNAPVVDVPVQIGKRERLAGRLVAVRVPAHVARKRQQRLQAQARKKGRQVSAEQLALCGWTLLLTNLPESLASAAEVVVLARCRWQIELLFKLWKSDAGLDKSRSAQPYRVLSELFGKMLGVVVQQWLLVAGCWSQSQRSLRQAASAVRQQALSLVSALRQQEQLRWVLEVTLRVLSASAPQHTSRKDPRTYQLLEQPSLFGASAPPAPPEAAAPAPADEPAAAPAPEDKPVARAA